MFERLRSWLRTFGERTRAFGQRNPRLTDVGLTFVVAAIYYGIPWRYRMLDPRFLDWIFNIEYDLAQFLTAISYYRFADWSFPITRFDTLFYPVGATITLADGLPLFAVPYKLLDRWLPPILQYFGVWLFVCVWLQGFIAKRILTRLSVSTPGQWAGTLLVVASAQLAYATEHVALWGHWLILAAFYLAMQPKFPFRRACVLAVLAQWVHPYLFAMVLAILATIVAKHIKERRIWLLSLGLGGCVLLSSWVAGYLEFAEATKATDGGYQADLTAFFNSGGLSSVVPKLHFHELQWGGFTYLGLGGLLGLLALLVKPFIRRWRAPVHEKSLLIICSLLALYGFSTKLMFLGEHVVTVPYLSELLEPVSARAIGRFVWPLAYYLLLFGVRAIDSLAPSRRLAWAFAGVVVLAQAADLGPWLYSQGRRADLWKPAELPPVSDTVRAKITDKTELLLFVPAIARRPCRGSKRWPGRYWQLAMFGAEQRLKTNAEFRVMARFNHRDFKSVCQFTQRMWGERDKHPEIAFVRPGE